MEQYWNIDSILRYLAVHTFMVNGDSYTGSMKQNYFLAEQNGKVTVLPWDYNLSFGAFGGGPGEPPKMGEEPKEQNKELNFKNDQTTEVINHAIDTPTIGVEMSSRPLVSVLLGKEKYKEKYHQYLNDLTKFASGDFINKLEIVENAIYPYIESETISFYTPDAHKTAFDVLKKFLNLRSLSIQKQLNGDIPSETEKQKGAALVVGDFSIKDMGSMGGPGGGPPMPGGNVMDKMMPPPEGMQSLNGQEGQNGMMPPPPGMPEMTQTQGNTTYYTITVIALLVLCIVFIGTKLFKRNY